MTSNTLTKKVIIIIIRIVPAIKLLSSTLSLDLLVISACIYIYYLIIYTTLTQKKQLHKFISKPTDLQLHLPIL